MKAGKEQKYIPERGDIIFIDFNPTKGSEQGNPKNKPRPAIIISPLEYNRLSSLALMCPITSKSKGLKFEVALDERTNTKGVILSDQIKCLDWKARKANFKEKAPLEVIEEVLAKIEPLVL